MTYCRSILTVMLVALPAATFAQAIATRPTTTWVANGGVVDAVARGDTVYVTGDFSRIGRRTGSWASIDLVTGEADSSASQLNGPVADGEPDDAGGFYLSGRFTLVGDTPRPGLAHLTSSGELDTGFSPSGFTSVIGSALVGGRLFVAIPTAGGIEYTLRALDASTGAPIEWSTSVVATAAPARGPGGSLLVQSGSELVSLNAMTGAVNWRATLILHDTSGAVGYGSERILGASVASFNIRRIDLSTGMASTIATADAICFRGQCSILNLKHHNGVLYMLGSFYRIQGVARPGEAAVNATTGELVEWVRPNLTSEGLGVGVKFFSFRNRLLYVGSRNRASEPVLILADPATGVADPLRVHLLGGRNVGGLDDVVMDVVDDGTRLRIAGSFRGVGGMERNGLAAVRWRDGEVLPWVGPPQRQPWNNALALAGTRLFWADFDGLREVDALTGVQVGPLIMAQTIVTLNVSGNRLFAAGTFSSVGGEPRRRLASFDISDGGLRLEDWAPQIQINRFIRTMLVIPPAVLISGDFEEIAGQPRPGVAAVDIVTGAPLAWVPPVGPPVYFDRSPTRLYLSGGFAGWAGAGSGGQMAFEYSGALAQWRPATPVGLPPSNDPVQQHRATVFGNRLYIGANYAIDQATGAVVPWTPELDFIERGTWKRLDNLGLALLTGSNAAGFYFYPAIALPGAVSGVTAAVSGNSITLSWPAVANANTYTVDAGLSPGAADYSVTVAQPQFSTTGPDGVYYLRVRANNESGSGSASTDLRIALGPGACATPPNAPRELTRVGATQPVVLQWMPPIGGPPPTNYALVVRLLPQGPAITRFDAGLMTTLAGHAPAGTYYLELKAENACGASTAVVATVRVE